MQNKPIHEELKTAAVPLLELLYKYGDPYTRIIVEQDRVYITQEEMSAPFPLKD